MTDFYDTINNLGILSFIAGSDQELIFTCYQADGISYLNITSGIIIWLLSPWGQPDVTTLELTSTGGDIIISTPAGHLYNDTFTVTIPTASTYSLNGKFIQQVVITDNPGDTFRPGQGIVLIQPAIQI